MLTSFALLSWLPLQMVVCQGEAEKALHLRADVLLALENGPVIVKLTLQNQGTKTIETGYLSSHSSSSNGHIVPPRHWIRDLTRPGYVVHSGISSPTGRLHPGDNCTRLFYLHHDYCSIPAGKAALKCTWPVYGPGREGKTPREPLIVQGPLLATPSTTVTVDVLRATPRQVQAVARDLVAALEHADRDPSGRQAIHIKDAVLHTRHEEFVPIALQLLRTQTVSESLITFVYDRSSTPRKGHDRLIDELVRANPLPAEAIFGCWVRWFHIKPFGFHPWALLSPASLVTEFAERCTFPYRFYESVEETDRRLRVGSLCYQKDGLERLAQAPNPRVRLLTLVTFGRQLSPNRRAVLTDELRKLGRPPSERQWHALLDRLDDERFPVREEASNALLGYGDVIAPRLREALKHQLAPEARARVERLLATFRNNPLAPLEQQTLSFFKELAEDRESSFSTDARATLKTLADADPIPSLAREARAAIADLDGRAQHAPHKGGR